MSSPPARTPSTTAIVISCGLAQICVTLDYMALSVALPAMSRDLHVSTGILQWALAAYLLAFASFLIVGGRLGDIFGRRKLLLIGLALFGGASLLGGLAPSVAVLIAARAIQGVGAAMFFPGTLSIIRNALPAEKVGRAIGSLTAVATVGIAMGPFIGGALTDSIGWRWVFYINAPIALGAILLARATAPESRDETASHHIDVAGLVTLAVGVVAVTLIPSLAEAWGWLSPKTIGVLLAGFAILVLFTVIERRVANPLIDLHLFANRSFSRLATSGAIANFVFTLSVMIFTLYFEDARNLSALSTGAMLLPFSIAGAIVSQLSGKVVARSGPRLPMAGGLVVAAAGFVLVAITDPTPYALDIVAMGIIGGGCALAYSSTNVSTISVVTQRQSGAAGGAVFTGLVIFAAFGVTVATDTVQSLGDGSFTSAAVETAIWAGAAVALVIGVLLIKLVPGKTRYEDAIRVAGATDSATTTPTDAANDAPTAERSSA